MNESYVAPRLMLNGLEEMLPSVEDLYRHADSQVTLWGLGLVEKGRHLHTQAALFRRPLVDFSARSKCPVWLGRVANSRLWVNIWQLAPMICVSILQS